MDLVTCRCAKCDAKLSTVINLWTQIGKHYLVPNHATKDGTYRSEQFAILTSGLPRIGEVDTVVGGCKLQDAQCASCGAGVGLKCLRSPANHALTSGQFILRTTSITIKLTGNESREVKPKIDQILKLRHDNSKTKGHTSSAPVPDEPFKFTYQKDHSNGIPKKVDNVDVLQLQASLDAQREDINRIDTSAFQVVSSFQAALSRVEQQVRQLSDSVDNVRRDEDGQRESLKSLETKLTDLEGACQHDTAISRIDQQLQATNKLVGELRQTMDLNKTEVAALRSELFTAKVETHQLREENTHLKTKVEEANQISRQGIETSKECATELSALRREMKQLKSELGRERSAPNLAISSPFPSHELDILTCSISKIGNRASQIESLQMEFELFKTRVQRLESRPITTTASRDDSSARDFTAQTDELTQSRFSGQMRQKRTSTGRDDTESFVDTPPKRMAMISDYSSAAAGYASAGDWHNSSPTITALTGSNGGNTPRLTKSGAIDRRTTKRGMSNTKVGRSAGKSGSPNTRDDRTTIG
ncbi:hypothetical protein G7046_g8678 [Stylonectria norvegica]|nr:hypothetical protein G7046_g8678 [Stylonectria norvegica]